MVGIDDLAKAYFLSAERCEEFRKVEPGMLQMLLIPAVTNRAFSSELYLKALLRLKSVNAHGHDLKTLFNLLDQERQKSIKIKLEETVFDDELKEIANLFVDWRYLYEKPVEKINISWQFLQVFSIALKAEYEAEAFSE